MATYQNGIQGSFSGKVGSVVGCSWKGIPYLRSLPKKRTGKISAAEAANRQRFALAQQWLKPLLPFVRQGFQQYSERVEGYIAAKSYLWHHAMIQENGLWKIVPENMLVSFGALLGIENGVVTYDAEHQELVFTWDNQVSSTGRQFDQVMLLAYEPVSAYVFFQCTGTFRKTGEDRLAIDPQVFSQPVLLYMAFVSADRQSQSNSTFLGTLII